MCRISSLPKEINQYNHGTSLLYSIGFFGAVDSYQENLCYFLIYNLCNRERNVKQSKFTFNQTLEDRAIVTPLYIVLVWKFIKNRVFTLLNFTGKLRHQQQQPGTEPQEQEVVVCGGSILMILLALKCKYTITWDIFTKHDIEVHSCMGFLSIMSKVKCLCQK
jgi:hypothetical protein